MAQVVHGGEVGFRALAYGMPHPGTVSFLQSQMQDLTQRLQGAGEIFLQHAQQTYDSFLGSDAVRMARAALRHVDTIWQSDAIQYLGEIGQFQNAPAMMVPYIMAEPETRAMYHAQRLDGYSESYVDIEPDRVGEMHYHYRRVMDGVIVLNEDDSPNAPEWYADTFEDDLMEGDEDLTIVDQNDILLSWQHQRHFIRQEGGDDFTSKFNARMG